MVKFDTEADAADVVIGYLRDLRYDVYCEVDSGVGRIDIVAKQGSILTAIEVKRSCKFSVLGQAVRRFPFVHRSVAAFPMPKDMLNTAHCFRAMHDRYGIGIWGIGRNRIDEFCAPKINRRPVLRHVERSLRDEQKNQRAGVNEGYWSPFRQTKERLISYVRKNQPCTLKSAIHDIRHHYSSDSSAYTSIGKWLRSGVIDEVKLTRAGLVLAEVVE